MGAYRRAAGGALALALTALAVGAVPASADDVSVDAAYENGERSLERPIRRVNRATRYDFNVARARKAIPAYRGLRRAIGKVRRSVARQQSSSPTGSRARKAALGYYDAGIVAIRYLERALRYLIRALKRDSPSDARKAGRLADRAERGADKADRLGVQAVKLFAQAKRERESVPPTPVPVPVPVPPTP